MTNDKPPPIGHNGPPKTKFEILLDAIGPKKPMKINPFQCGAAWTRYASNKELRELAVNEARIARKKASLAELIKKRQRIMNRNLRRAQRDKTKEE